MKNLIWLGDIVFIVDNPLVITTHSSSSYHFINKGVIFCLKFVSWMAVHNCMRTNQNVLKLSVNNSLPWGFLCELTLGWWWVETIGACSAAGCISWVWLSCLDILVFVLPKPSLFNYLDFEYTWSRNCYPSGAHEFTPVFSGVRLTRSFVLYVCFVDRCLSFGTFSFDHCVVCSSSMYGFWLTLSYLQTLLSDARRVH